MILIEAKGNRRIKGGAEMTMHEVIVRPTDSYEFEFVFHNIDVTFRGEGFDTMEEAVEVIKKFMKTFIESDDYEIVEVEAYIPPEPPPQGFGIWEDKKGK